MQIKPLFFSGLLLFCSLTFAGYDNDIGSTYDLDTGIYIQAVSNSADDEVGYFSSKVTDRYATNVFVFNPIDNTYRYLLDKYYGKITTYVVETSFEKDRLYDGDKSVIRGTYQFLSGYNTVENNNLVAKREINQNIIIETYNEQTKKYTVWKANKLVGDASIIFSYNRPAKWHLDVKNQQIRLITPGLENKQVRLKIKSYAW